MKNLVRKSNDKQTNGSRLLSRIFFVLVLILRTQLLSHSRLVSPAFEIPSVSSRWNYDDRCGKPFFNALGKVSKRVQRDGKKKRIITATMFNDKIYVFIDCLLLPIMYHVR